MEMIRPSWVSGLARWAGGWFHIVRRCRAHYQDGAGEILLMTAQARAAIITGGGSGIGRAIVHALSAVGVHCCIMGRRPEPLRATAAEVGGASGRIEVVVGDVGRDDDRRRLVNTCLESFGTLDVLVNNAGYSTAAPLLDFSPKAWRQELRDNLEGAAFLSLGALEVMRDAGRGRVVNIGSVYATLAPNHRFYAEQHPAQTPERRGPIRALAYGASKGGLLTLTRELAVASAAWGITVNMVSPGMIEVESRPLDSAVRERLCAATPAGRLGTPADVAMAVRFLVSDDASFITGHELRVDGGWSIW